MNSNQNIDLNIFTFLKRYFKFEKLHNEFIINKFYRYEDEVDLLFFDFFNTFHINHKNFNILEYFEPEPYFGFNQIKNLFLRRKEYPPITIQHLIDVAKKKEWFNP